MEINVHKSDDKGNIITLLVKHCDCWHRNWLMVPAGFESDGCSIPRFLWSTISPAIDPRTLRAGVCHDWIYRRHPAGWTRSMADSMFYDFCRADGLNWWAAQKAYWGLRMFGGAAWEAAKK